MANEEVSGEMVEDVCAVTNNNPFDDPLYSWQPTESLYIIACTCFE
ncbi:hypothetical protein CGMCC3_g283 [Colletotrichum fructicola]|nr:uncharacterized protein CGMCC3_g283 [Colletotrichum fructicola]KAE9583879.1 hypothetical protein CGMCC3_g283 [Colletotrichum fructicola]